jgi:hypothetical protein
MGKKLKRLLLSQYQKGVWLPRRNSHVQLSACCMLNAGISLSSQLQLATAFMKGFIRLVVVLAVRGQGHTSNS